MRVDRHALRLVHEPRVQVHERGERRDHHGERDDGRDHGEREPKEPTDAGGERDRGGEREQDGEERARRPVEEERDRDDEDPEHREVSRDASRDSRSIQASRYGPPTRRTLRIAWRGAVHCGVDPRERRVAGGRGRGVERHHDAEEAIANEPLSPEEVRAGREAPERLGRGAVGGRCGPRTCARVRIEDRHGRDARERAQRRLERAGLREDPRVELGVGLEEQHDERPLREDALELARGEEVRVIGHDEPVDGALRRDAGGEPGGDRDEQRVQDEDRPAERHDGAEDALEPRPGHPRQGSRADPVRPGPVAVVLRYTCRMRGVSLALLFASSVAAARRRPP